MRPSNQRSFAGLMHHRAKRIQQRGATAIEFALLFPLFFAMFYASISYATAMLTIQALKHAANEGARAAIQVLDPLDFTTPTFETATRTIVEQQVRASLGWMPTATVDQIVATGIRLTALNNLINTEVGVTQSLSIKVDVTLLNYADNGLLPVLTLPLIGAIPRLPEDLSGTSTLLLNSSSDNT